MSCLHRGRTFYRLRNQLVKTEQAHAAIVQMPYSKHDINVQSTPYQCRLNDRSYF